MNTTKVTITLTAEEAEVVMTALGRFADVAAAWPVDAREARRVAVRLRARLNAPTADGRA
jgi:hypothetical protein